MDIEGLVYQKDRQLRVPMPANDIVWELCHLVLPKFGAELGLERRTPNRTFTEVQVQQISGPNRTC